MNFDERTLNGMSVLAAVVRSGSFAAAGRELNMTQPGVSRAIARLEARMGVRLLERTTRSVALTQEGRLLHEQIVPLLAGLEEAAASVTQQRGRVTGRLRVHADPICAQLVLGPQLHKFLRAFPEVQLELSSSPRLGNLVAEGFDLAIRFGEPRLSGLVARRLLETRVLTVASPAYLKRYGHPKTPHELASGKHRLIDFRDPESHAPFDWILQQGKMQVNIATDGHLLLNDAATMLAACLTGYGVCQGLALGIEPWIRAGRLVELLPDWPDERYPLFALYPSRRYLPHRTRAFIDFVIALLAARPDSRTAHAAN